MKDKGFERDDSLWSGAFEFLKKISEALTSIGSWWVQNADKISAYLEAFCEFGVWMDAVIKLAEEHLMFTDDITMDYAHKFSESENVKKTLEDYYIDDDYKNFNSLVDRCKESKCLQENQKFFEQIMSAYERGHFQLACTGLFALIDRVLADNTSNAKNTSFLKRIETIKSKLDEKVELDEVEMKTFCIYILMDTENGSIFDDSDFRKEEPELINRHWLLHGRTKRNESFFDFLLVLLWLDAIIYMAELSEKEN